MTGIKRDKNRSTEQGATIIVVTICLAALVGMAALAIDVASLYVARGEAQRAANAAALAGARMFVASGLTSLAGVTSPPVTQADVCQNGDGTTPAAANLQAAAAASNNLISGQAAIVQSITCDFTNPGNPRITVKIQSGTLPTFFAKIWGGAASTATATATAEAYNASGSSTPIAVTVKPWLLPNCDPSSITCTPTSNFFVDSSGIANNGSFLGHTIQLRRISSGSTGGNGSLPPTLTFYPLNVPITPSPVCPGNAGSCASVGSNPYLDNIACSSQFQLACGQPIGRGQTVPVQGGFGLTNETKSGARCLIHATGDGLGQGQDILQESVPDTLPVQLVPGENNPNTAFATAGTDNMSRSDSIVAVPLYDGSDLCSSGSCNNSASVVGFLQLGLTQTLPSGNQIEAVILNAVSCGNVAYPPSVTAISGGGFSPIPVRLVRNP